MSDYPEFPECLLVANRRPLTPEQQARVDAAFASARAREQERANLRAAQRERRRQKDLIHFEKLHAKQSGAAKVMPASGRDALRVIRAQPAVAQVTPAARRGG